MKFRLSTLLLVVVLGAVGIAGLYHACRAYMSSAGVLGRGASAEAANGWLWPELQLPPMASDVTFYTDFGVNEAEFAISEKAFLQWTQSKGWTVTPIENPILYFEPMWLKADLRPVRRGYSFAPPDGTGIFDADRNRASFWISTFP